MGISACTGRLLKLVVRRSVKISGGKTCDRLRKDDPRPIRGNGQSCGRYYKLLNLQEGWNAASDSKYHSEIGIRNVVLLYRIEGDPSRFLTAH